MSTLTPGIERTRQAIRALWLRRPPVQVHRTLWPRTARRPSPRQFTTFEKVIVANTAIIVLDTLAGWWITQHNPETYHYVIDTTFIALATLLSLAVNFALLRAAFAPLHSVLATIQAVEHGDLDARLSARDSDADVLALARAFNGMLDRLQAARDEVAARVLHAQEDERRRLALELHDQTGQSLTALTLHAQAIVQRLAAVDGPAADQARDQARHLGLLAERTLAEVQALARQLRPALLDDLGLEAALRWLAEDARDRLGVRVVVCTDGASGTLPRLLGEVETVLFRIAQESLTNAVRHGRAEQVRMTLRISPMLAHLCVEDSGCGFDTTTSERQAYGGGQGIAGMRERARLAGGQLHIRSRPGRGCIVRVLVPASREPEREASRGRESVAKQTADRGDDEP